ncbi:uncharacterized protein B0P05DRAFT_535430 [Gilbertella persicaria]|uniref:uncharacterized protein n=1 Tax=Gilbertella persicaria TaxID=101096 RepID=UPI00221EE53B|nr:uncharacterized protein B0P05DRAFT_535430 [Gilbertella persicaria]KAI8084401.1 hypothetical protein B0P05DRAFT_535430 [Gilbertella persicaria]
MPKKPNPFDSLTQRQQNKKNILFCLLVIGCIVFYWIYGQPTTLPPKEEKESFEQMMVDKTILPVIHPDPFDYHTPTKDEKYVTYLPHSGFHNQRIELENALLLAAYLNRTLLLPSVYLGNPAFPWLRFDKMYERLLLQTKNGLDYCSQLRQDEPWPSECLNYPRWTSVPWTFFYDLTELKQHVRIIFRDDLSLEWIQANLDVKQDDIYLFKDYSPFDYRIYDLPESRTPLTRFVNRIELDTLEAIQEKVLFFGSVFGSYRVLAQTPEHREWLKLIRKTMIFSNPTLMTAASRIVEKLGGVGSFVGIHIRVGDGLFKVRASIQIDDIFHRLVDDYTDLTESELESYYDSQHDQDRKENNEYEIRQLREDSQHLTGGFDKPIRVQHPENIQKSMGPASSELSVLCTPGDGRNDRFAKTTVFIATDCPHPRTHPLLRKIFSTFPCAFVLSDFKDDLTELDKIEVIQDKVKLESYLIPMVDAMIAAQGHVFYGTNASTFSTYIQRQLHPVYTNQPIELQGAPNP